MIKPILVFLSFIWATACIAEDIKIAVTTSFHNSGLSDILLPALKADTGIEVQLLVVGTGQALRLGRAGDVDALLVHAKSAELTFVNDGFAPHRREIMYNDFVLVGPKADPANIKNARSAAEALGAIRAAQEIFVTRGDNSGTHSKELSLWAVDTNDFGSDWYRDVGAGMGAALNVASGLNAYILSDRASWLKFGNKGDLALLFEGDPVLFNQYAYLPISSEKHAHVASETALRVEAWLTSERAQALINGYKLNGVQLFTFNAQ